MKAGQLARILQSVEPETDVNFFVGFDIEDRRNIGKACIDDPDILADIDTVSVEIGDFYPSIKVDVTLYPNVEKYK